MAVLAQIHCSFSLFCIFKQMPSHCIHISSVLFDHNLLHQISYHELSEVLREKLPYRFKRHPDLEEDYPNLVENLFD